MPTLILPSGRVDGHLAQRGHETTGLATRGTDGSYPPPSSRGSEANRAAPGFDQQHMETVSVEDDRPRRHDQRRRPTRDLELEGDWIAVQTPGGAPVDRNR